LCVPQSDASQYLILSAAIIEQHREIGRLKAQIVNRISCSVIRHVIQQARADIIKPLARRIQLFKHVLNHNLTASDTSSATLKASSRKHQLPLAQTPASRGLHPIVLRPLQTSTTTNARFAMLAPLRHPDWRTESAGTRSR